MYASSEAARGVPVFCFPAPKIETGSVEEFKAVIDGGTLYSSRTNHTKPRPTLWPSALV